MRNPFEALRSGIDNRLSALSLVDYTDEVVSHDQNRGRVVSVDVFRGKVGIANHQTGEVSSYNGSQVAKETDLFVANGKVSKAIVVKEPTFRT